MKKSKSNTVKIIAKKNVKSILDDWTSEILKANPTKKDYENVLSFVKDIIKKLKQNQTI